MVKCVQLIAAAKAATTTEELAAIRRASREQAHKEIMGKDPERAPTQEELAAIDQRTGGRK